MTNREMFLFGVMTVCAAVIIGMVVMLARPAHGSAVCLTKHEARKLWPKRHLYWYSGDHCWSNRRGGPPTGVKYDLIRENHAEEKTPPTEKKPSVMFPDVKQIIPWVDPKLYEPRASTLSHRLLDIDELTAKNTPPDPPECCWPALNPDGTLK